MNTEAEILEEKSTAQKEIKPIITFNPVSNKMSRKDNSGNSPFGVYPHQIANNTNKNNKTSNQTIQGPKINEVKIINRTNTFDYKGQKVFLAILDYGNGGRQLKYIKASHQAQV